jgi:seryl-tRNA synthetase
MHDIKSIRDNPQGFDEGLARRGLAPLSGEILALDQIRRDCVQKLQDGQARRNAASKEIGAAMAKNDKATAEALKTEVAGLKSVISEAEAKEREVAEKLDLMLATIPNIPLADVPVGSDEKGNKEVRRFGEPRRMAHAKQHFDIGENLRLMDFDAAARISGARFVIMKGALARMERALAQFMLDLHTTENGYTEHFVPLMVRDEAMFGTGQLPKFAEDLFATTDGRWLIPTAEVSLTNLVRDSILEAAELPMRLTAYTPCFRAEAGAAGRDTRGMIRQHQFTKVEMVSITSAEESRAELERMTQCAEKVLQRLNLPYRVMQLCTGDMGFSARMTYDIEVWLPGQDTYREISSCSVCGDFQARRMNARYRGADGKPAFVHTLNGSGLAVGRTLIAVMENYLNEDGTISVPEALRPYMGGMERIGYV